MMISRLRPDFAHYAAGELEKALSLEASGFVKADALRSSKLR
jgi:hypothetical protein